MRTLLAASFLSYCACAAAQGADEFTPCAGPQAGPGIAPGPPGPPSPGMVNSGAAGPAPGLTGGSPLGAQCTTQEMMNGSMASNQCWYSKEKDMGCCISFFRSRERGVVSLVNAVQPDGEFQGSPGASRSPSECGKFKKGPWSKCPTKTCANVDGQAGSISGASCSTGGITVCWNDDLLIRGGSCGGERKCEELGAAGNESSTEKDATGDKDSSPAKDSAAAATDEPVDQAAEPSGDIGVGRVPKNERKTKNSSRSCFPADAHVHIQSGQSKRMDQLVVGDRVRVGKTQYSDIFMFTHKMNDGQLYEFVRFELSSGEFVEATPGHYVYANGELVAAASVRVGDWMDLASGAASQVAHVKFVSKRGLYNPQTLSGDLVVNGVLVSTYTTAVNPLYAHKVLAPLRFIYSWTGLATSILDEGTTFASNWPTSGSAEGH